MPVFLTDTSSSVIFHAVYVGVKTEFFCLAQYVEEYYHYVEEYYHSVWGVVKDADA